MLMFGQPLQAPQGRAGACGGRKLSVARAGSLARRSGALGFVVPPPFPATEVDNWWSTTKAHTEALAYELYHWSTLEAERRQQLREAKGSLRPKTFAPKGLRRKSGT